MDSNEKTGKTESEELLENLPKKRSWDGTYLSFYQGFWCPSISLSSTIAFQQQFQAQDKDIIVASFPKSGTTWLKALSFSIANRSTFPPSQSPLLSANPHELVPSLEQSIYYSRQYALLEPPQRPKVFSTHVPFSSLPASIKTSQCRIVYICRNPFDQFISRWLFDSQLWSETHYSMSLEECLDMFCEGVCYFGPIWDHILGYWKASKEMPEKMLFLKYEDLKEETALHIKRLAEFLGFPFSEEEESEGVAEELGRLCSFETLKDLKTNKNRKHPTGRDYSSFFRKGMVGDWRNYLTPSMAERIHKMMSEKFEGSGLAFKIS